MDKNWENLKKYAPKACLLIIEKLTVQLNFVSTHYEQKNKKKFSKSAGTEQNLDSKILMKLLMALNSRYFCIDKNKSGRLNHFYRTKK